jgi:hypothetical protein
MRSRFCRLFLFLGLTLFARADTAERSLGQNLDYLRVHALPEDLPASPAPRKNALVVDLRFVKANQEAATAFSAWLQFQSRPASPVIVLINNQTAPALLTSLASKAPAGVVTIGPAARGFKPDVALEVTSEADRAAYDALENGTALDDLFIPKLDKPRHDEASNAKERAGGPVVANDADATDENPIVESKEKEKDKEVKKAADAPSAPFDTVLQRAVHLHRALLALKKI